MEGHEVGRKRRFKIFVSFPVKLDISNFFPEGLFLGFFNTNLRMRMLRIINMQNLKLQG